MKMQFMRRLALLCAVLACGALLALPAAAAQTEAPCAEDGDMDYIRSYVVTVDPREDGSADITYDIDWQVIERRNILQRVKPRYTRQQLLSRCRGFGRELPTTIALSPRPRRLFLRLSLSLAHKRLPAP